MLPSQDHAPSHRGGLTTAHCPEALPVPLRGQRARTPRLRGRQCGAQSSGGGSPGRGRRPVVSGAPVKDDSPRSWAVQDSRSVGGTRGGRGAGLFPPEGAGRNPMTSCGRVGVAGRRGRNPVTLPDLGAGRRGQRGHAMPGHAPNAHDTSVRRGGRVPAWGGRTRAAALTPRPFTPPPRRWAAPCSSAAGKATTCRAPRPGPAWRTSRGAARGPSVSVSDS